MKLEDLKVGMFICKLNTDKYMKVDRVNAKSITSGWENIKADELDNYMIVDNVIVKARTLQRLFSRENDSLFFINDKLTKLIEILKHHGDLLSLNSDKLTDEIEETINNINNLIVSCCEVKE